MEKGPQGSQCRVAQRLACVIVIDWEAALELLPQNLISGLVHVNDVGVSELTIPVMIVSLQKEHGVLMG